MTLCYTVFIPIIEIQEKGELAMCVQGGLCHRQQQKAPLLNRRQVLPNGLLLKASSWALHEIMEGVKLHHEYLL